MSYTPIYDHLKKTFEYPPFVPKTLPPDPYSTEELLKYHEEQAELDEQNFQEQQNKKQKEQNTVKVKKTRKKKQ
jgi:hypothetical protein